MVLLEWTAHDVHLTVFQIRIDHEMHKNPKFDQIKSFSGHLKQINVIFKSSTPKNFSERTRGTPL